MLTQDPIVQIQSDLMLLYSKGDQTPGRETITLDSIVLVPSLDLSTFRCAGIG